MRIGQITDTHIVSRGELLYGIVDSAGHLARAIDLLNAAEPKLDAVMITGDCVDEPTRENYQHFRDCLSALEMPAHLIPGNHDDPELMAELFGDTVLFPVKSPPHQYALDYGPVRILALNSWNPESDLGLFDSDRLDWLNDQLAKPGTATVIAIHHPPMITGIDYADLNSPEWFGELGGLLSRQDDITLIMSGHVHRAITGALASIPVMAAGSTAHKLIGPIGRSRAPVFVSEMAMPVVYDLHGSHFVTSEIFDLEAAEENRIDKLAGKDWDEMQIDMRRRRRVGSMR
jgi:3',5'-cyclic AMP phosphodiesterase CpdA